MLSHVGHIRDPRASTSNNTVPDEAWTNLPPEIVEPKQRRAALKGDRFRVKGSPYEREVRLLTAMITFRKEEDGQGDTARTIYISSRPTWDLRPTVRRPSSTPSPRWAPSAPPWPSSSARDDLSRSSTSIASWPARSWSAGAEWKGSTRPEVEQNKMLPNGHYRKDRH